MHQHHLWIQLRMSRLIVLVHEGCDPPTGEALMREPCHIQPLPAHL